MSVEHLDSGTNLAGPGIMDVFDLHRYLIADYAAYTRSFIRIRDDRIRDAVESEIANGLLWPEPLLQLNPSSEPGATNAPIGSRRTKRNDSASDTRSTPRFVLPRSTVITNWPLFEPVFATMRELVDVDFSDINELRNVVYHFRRGITPKDTDRLRRFRDRLRYDRNLFLDQRALNPTEHALAAGSTTQ